MPERSSKKKIPEDVDIQATDEKTSKLSESSDKPQKNPAAVELGRLGGKKGGPARAKKLTAEQRSDIARKAAQKRWQKD